MENPAERIEKKLQQLREQLKKDKGAVQTTERRIGLLRAYRDMLKTGLKLGDAFQINGTFAGRSNPKGIVVDIENGQLVGLIIGVHDKLTKTEFVFFPYRLNDVKALGEHPLGAKYRRPFDPSDLLEDGDLQDG